MKKFIAYGIVVITFMSQNLFAQVQPAGETMDMKVYTQWMLAGVIILIFSILAILLFDGSKEFPEDTVSSPEIYLIDSSGSYLKNYLPGLSLELTRIRFMLTSVLLIFLIVLLLLII